MEHYNVYNSNVIEKYNVSEVPKSILVGEDGIVKFNGNPTSRNL